MFYAYNLKLLHYVYYVYIHIIYTYNMTYYIKYYYVYITLFICSHKDKQYALPFTINRSVVSWQLLLLGK